MDLYSIGSITLYGNMTSSYTVAHTPDRYWKSFTTVIVQVNDSQRDNSTYSNTSIASNMDK